MPRLNTGNQTGPRVGPRQAGIYPQPEEPGFCPIGSGDLESVQNPIFKPKIFIFRAKRS